MGGRPSLSVKEFLTHPPPANFYWKNSQSSFKSELFKILSKKKETLRIFFFKIVRKKCQNIDDKFSI